MDPTPNRDPMMQSEPTLSSSEMQVLKRNGTFENVSFDKILNRIKKVAQKVNITHIDFTKPCIKTIDQLINKITTSEIDELLAAQCVSMSTVHPDYGIIASRLIMSSHHKNTYDSFYKTMETFSGIKKKPLISGELWDICQIDHFIKQIEETIDYSRDYIIDYFGFKTLEKSYLLKEDGVSERVQHMWMRVSIGIHGFDIESVKKTYELMSNKYFIHATPTLFNAGTPRPQLSSCFLTTMEEDSINGIFNTIKDCALISKYSGGIGLSISNIRAINSKVFNSNCTTNGIIPMLRVLNNTAKYVDQGGKRKGSFAIYLEPWHAEIKTFLNLKKNHGNDDLKARDLFYALWISDLFMERVEKNEKWSLFCPNDCNDLIDLWGDEFTNKYCEYEKDSTKVRETISARALWFQILDAQMETGNPYILYKDACNRKSNQKNLGTIRNSNLCTEIIEYSNSEESAVCNLASVALPTFVSSDGNFDYDKLESVVKTITCNLNRIIDINFYPIEKTRRSNLRHRPIGIGVQGLADTFVLMGISFYSEEAKLVNKRIFETMYFASLTQSNELAMKDGPYETFNGSPASKGILQFDMWNSEPLPGWRDWESLRESVVKHGIRNSLLLAPMPTASTSQILGFNECFEPFTSNIYSRNTLAGEFVVINKYLIRELISDGAWSESVKNSILKNNGSIQHFEFLPKEMKDKYKTVWEIPMKHIIDMSADRGIYICQSQSLNLWLEDPSYNTLTSMYFYGWKKGLKTGIYYLRRRARHQAQQFTIEPTKADVGDDDTHDNQLDEGVCESCSA